MDLNRLTQGERIAALSAIALFIIMFLNWYTIDTLGGSLSAWDAYSVIDIILLVTVVCTVGAAVLRASDSDLDVPASQIVTVLGALSFLLILFRIISTPSWSAPLGLGSVDTSVTYGVFLGLIAAAGIAFGGYRTMQEEGTTFADAAARFSGGAGTGEGPSGGTPPPPPPSSTPPSPPPPPPSSGA